MYDELIAASVGCGPNPGRLGQQQLALMIVDLIYAGQGVREA